MELYKLYIEGAFVILAGLVFIAGMAITIWNSAFSKLWTAVSFFLLILSGVILDFGFRVGLRIEDTIPGRWDMVYIVFGALVIFGVLNALNRRWPSHW